MSEEPKLDMDEFIDRYSDVELYFKHYYKYSFTFEGEAEDGTVIQTSFTGQSDIYRYTVTPDTPKKVKDPEQFWHYVQAVKDNEVIFEYHDMW